MPSPRSQRADDDDIVGARSVAQAERHRRASSVSVASCRGAGERRGAHELLVVDRLERRFCPSPRFARLEYGAAGPRFGLRASTPYARKNGDNTITHWGLERRGGEILGPQATYSRASDADWHWDCDSIPPCVLGATRRHTAQNTLTLDGCGLRKRVAVWRVIQGPIESYQCFGLSQARLVVCCHRTLYGGHQPYCLAVGTTSARAALAISTCV